MKAREEHKAKVLDIFDDLEAKDKEIFVKVDRIIYSNSDHDTPESVELSVFTEKMYDYDCETILNEKVALSISNYRPYFAFINLPIEHSDSVSYKEMESNWFQAILNPSNEDNCKQGTLFLSASPIKVSQIYISLNNKKGLFKFKGIDIDITAFIDEKYNCAFPCAQKEEVEKELCGVESPSKFRYIDIYNIGHGNADYIVFDKKRILFDIGYPRRRRPSVSSYPFPKALRSFGRLRPNLVIISHWDTDHFLGYAYASDSIFDVNWIAPSLDKKKASMSSRRLVAFLNIIGKLRLIDRSNCLGMSFDCGNFSLLMGQGNDSRISPINCEGLYIQLQRSDKSSLLLAGDVPYICMDQNIFGKQLELLHVPHHCSNMELQAFRSIKGDNAVITVADKREVYKNHEIELLNKFKDVKYTVGNSPSNAEDIRSIRYNGNKTMVERRK